MEDYIVLDKYVLMDDGFFVRASKKCLLRYEITTKNKRFN